MDMDMEVIVARAMADAVANNPGQAWLGPWWRHQARVAIAAYEAARQEAQDAEDERLYTEFHK